MLGTLRKHSKSVIIYVLFAVIIVVFIFTFNVASPDAGCGTGGGKKATSVMKVGDEQLDLSALTMGLALSADPPNPGAFGDPRAFQAEMVYRSTRFARLRGDPKFGMYMPDPRTVSPVKIRKVADDLTETFLTSDEGEARGLRASPDEIRARIVRDFTDDTGRFKKKTYEDWVRYSLRTSLPKFEEFVGREIVREKLIGLLTANVTVPDREARHVAAQRKTVRTYEYVEIDPTLLGDAYANAAGPLPGGPTAEEVDSWLAAHKDEAEKYFAEHKSEFAVPATYEFHVIKSAAPSKSVVAGMKDDDARKAAEDRRAEARKKAEELAATLTDLSGAALVAAFEKAAPTSSDDAATAANGGRSAGALTRKDVDGLSRSLARKFDGMKAGEFSGVVEDDDGFFLAVLDRKNAGGERTFEDVKVAVARKIVSREKGKAAVDKMGADLLARAQGSTGTALVDLVKEANAPFAPENPIRFGNTGDLPGMPDSLSGMFDWNPNALTGIGESEELSKAAAGLTSAQPVAAKVFSVKGSEARYILRLAGEKVEAATDDDVARARDDLVAVKKQAWYREWYRNLKTQAQAKGRLAEYDALTNLVRDEVRAIDESVQRVKSDPKAPKGMPIQIPAEQ